MFDLALVLELLKTLPRSELVDIHRKIGPLLLVDIIGVSGIAVSHIALCSHACLSLETPERAFLSHSFPPHMDRSPHLLCCQSALELSGQRPIPLEGHL